MISTIILTVMMAIPGPIDNEVAWSAYLAGEMAGKAEHVCVDGSRVDILTNQYAYEVEWAKKWKESIGQAVLYGILTDRLPGIILLKRNASEDEHVLRCVTVCNKLNILLKVVDVSDGAVMKSSSAKADASWMLVAIPLSIMALTFFAVICIIWRCSSAVDPN